MITLLRGGWIAAWDGATHRVVQGGEVAFEDETILYAGPRFEGEADRIIENRDWLICPGFINLHGHVGVDPMVPFVDIPRSEQFAPGPEFAQNAPLEMWPTLTEEEQRTSAEFCLVQMVRTGTTTVVDAHGYGAIWWLGNPPTDEAALAEVVGRVGSRAYLALGFRSARSYSDAEGNPLQHWDEPMGVAGLEEGLRFALAYRDAFDGRVQAILTPHAVEKFTPDLLRRTIREARAVDLRVQIHTAQSTNEVELVMERHGDSPVGLLHSLGFLGPDVILGHCVFISDHPAVGGKSDRDLRLIAESGASVAHAPLAFARRDAEALHSLPRYLDYGINVGIGCDIWPADIISEMRMAWLIGKQVHGDVDRPTCREVFDAATRGSADALGRSDLGRLSPGTRADLVCVDMSAYHFGPVLDPIRSLISLGTGQDVDEVYVDGKRIVSGGQVLNVDEDALKAAAPHILSKLHQAAAERDPAGRTAESILSWRPHREGKGA
jgi:cytosine/adenosine deaminase-related metal-dependent hydrolase